MLPLDDLLPAVRAAIPKFHPIPSRGPSPNAEQATCILHPRGAPLQIVAGPGSGKTTVLVLRALRHVVVDGLLPEQVLLTTFTKKAAAEIRTRLIEWGQQLLAHLRLQPSAELAAHLERVDVNRFVTGTLDSICEEALRDARSATDPARQLDAVRRRADLRRLRLPTLLPSPSEQRQNASYVPKAPAAP